MFLSIILLFSYIQVVYETRFYVESDTRFSPHGVLMSREIFSKESLGDPPHEFALTNFSGDTWRIPNPDDWVLADISDSGNLLLLRTVKGGTEIAVTDPLSPGIKRTWVFNPVLKTFFGQDNISVLVFTRDSTYVVSPNSSKRASMPGALTGDALNSITVIASKRKVLWYSDGKLKFEKTIWTPFVRDLEIASGGKGFYMMTPHEIAYFDSTGKIVWRKSHVFSLLTMHTNEYAVGLCVSENGKNTRLIVYDALTGESYQNFIIPSHLFGYENSIRQLFLNDSHLNIVFKDRVLIYRITRN